MVTLHLPGRESAVLVEVRVTLPDGFLPHAGARRQQVAFRIEPADFLAAFAQPGPGARDMDYVFSELIRKNAVREGRT